MKYCRNGKKSQNQNVHNSQKEKNNEKNIKFPAFDVKRSNS